MSQGRSKICGPIAGGNIGWIYFSAGPIFRQIVSAKLVRLASCKSPKPQGDGINTQEATVCAPKGGLTVFKVGVQGSILYPKGNDWFQDLIFKDQLCTQGGLLITRPSIQELICTYLGKLGLDYFGIQELIGTY